MVYTAEAILPIEVGIEPTLAYTLEENDAA